MATVPQVNHKAMLSWEGRTPKAARSLRLLHSHFQVAPISADSPCFS